MRTTLAPLITVVRGFLQEPAISDDDIAAALDRHALQVNDPTGYSYTETRADGSVWAYDLHRAVGDLWLTLSAKKGNWRDDYVERALQHARMHYALGWTWNGQVVRQ